MDLDYFGNPVDFSSILSRMTSLLVAENSLIVISTDLDKTLYFSPQALSESINPVAFIQQQKETIARFRAWLEDLPGHLRKRLMFIINTTRTVSGNPALADDNDYLVLPQEQWPQEQLSGLMPPDVLISQNGQVFHFFDSPVFRGRMPELIDRVKTCWPPKSSGFSDRDKKALKQMLVKTSGIFPKCVQAFNQCSSLGVLHELATSCGAYMRTYPGHLSGCSHVHIYDVRVNKGTALVHLLNQIQQMHLIPNQLHFVTAGDDYTDLPMLFPLTYIAPLDEEELLSTFSESLLPDRVFSCHAGSILSADASEEMNDAIKTIQTPGTLVRATTPGLPGIIEKALELLENKLNTYAL